MICNPGVRFEWFDQKVDIANLTKWDTSVLYKKDIHEAI